MGVVSSKGVPDQNGAVPQPSSSGRWHEGNGDSERFSTGPRGVPRDRFFFGMHAANLYGTEAEDLDLYGTGTVSHVNPNPNPTVIHC